MELTPERHPLVSGKVPTRIWSPRSSSSFRERQDHLPLRCVSPDRVQDRGVPFDENLQPAQPNQLHNAYLKNEAIFNYHDELQKVATALPE